MAPPEGPAQTRGPGEEGGVFRRAGGGFCGDRRGTRSERRREKKREGTQEEETAHGMGEESGRVEIECGRVVQGTGDCKINARVGVSATTRPSVSCRRVRACPATTRAPRTPDLNVASKRGLERCKINARFCAGRTRPSLRSTLRSGGRGGKPSADRRRPAPPPPMPVHGKKKRAFILQSPVQDFPQTAASPELAPISSHLSLENRCPTFFPLPLQRSTCTGAWLSAGAAGAAPCS